LVEQAAEMLFLHDTKGNIIDVNQAAEKSTGYSKKELLDMKLFDLDPFAKKRKDSVKYWKKLKPGDPSLTFETNHKRKNGSVYPAEVTLSKIVLSDGEFLLGLAKDITERKKAEKELKDAQKRLKQMNLHLEKKVEERTDELSKVNSQLKKEIEERKNAEERYRSLFEASPELIGEFDKNGCVVSINPALAESLNVLPDDAIGKKVSVFSTEDVMENRIKKAKQVLKTNKMIDFEDSRKDRYFHNIYVPMVHSNGDRTVQLIAKDITDRKKAELENIRNMKYLENVINSASEIIMAVDQEHKIVLWNKAAEKFTGYKRKQVLNKKINDLEVFEKAVDLKENLRQVSSGKNLVLKNTFIKPKKGNYRIIRFNASPIRQTQENMGNTSLFIGTDVTIDSEYHGRILKGCSYMVSGDSFKSAFELFKTLTFSEYKGLYITRGKVDRIDFKNQLKNSQFLFLENKIKNKKDTISNLDGLINKIKIFCEKNKNSVILLDRIDYLLTNFSFEELIKKLYLINDIIYETDSILVVYFDPNIFDKQQIAIVENEFMDLPGQKIDDVDISNDLYDILEFIYERNENQVLVSFKDVGKKFSIVSKTTSKRIDRLVEKGLVYIKKEGRRKTLHVSEKGNRLLNNRKTN
jgi:PAS domain S-box-containing protein